MNATFASDPVVITLVVLATLAAIVLLSLKPRAHRWLLLGLQPLCAALLLAALLLDDELQPRALIVLTEGATSAQGLDDARAMPLVALPGAPRGEGIEPMPDLATALRRYPTATRVHVVGDGLEQRDREALGQRDVSHSKTTRRDAQAALTELERPRDVRAGAWWTLRGRVQHGTDVVVELLDPSARIVAATAPDAEGRFELPGLSRATGRAMFEVRLRRDERILQTVPVAVVAGAGSRPRVLLLGATPSPELKYLRRWALDAGVELESRIALAPGMAQRRDNTAIDAAMFADLDLLVIDERSWAQVAAQRDALRDAIAGGLGLLIRVTGPIPDRVAQDWQVLGVAVAVDAGRPGLVELALPGTTDSQENEFHAWPARMEGTEQVAMLRDREGRVLGAYQSVGRGRIGAWWLADSHRLMTRGQRESHASMWSTSWSTLSRARASTAPTIDEPLIVGQRAGVCGLKQPADVIDPSGRAMRLLPDPEQGDCAALWPVLPGWHAIQFSADGATPSNSIVASATASIASSKFVFAYSPTSVASLTAHSRQAATDTLVNRDDELPGNLRTPASLRAALLFAWLCVAALIWWLERRQTPRSASAGNKPRAGASIDPRSTMRPG